MERIGISELFPRVGALKITKRRQLIHNYNDIISLENLCLAWQEFIVGKKSKQDVQKFERNLMDNIVELNQCLVNETYQHGGYESFYINDPKRRHIHKASVRDRLLHHAVYRILYPFFDRTFIAGSFSCRNNKGMHRATVASGVDFLGWKHFTNHRILRKTTKKRMLRRIAVNPTNETLQSYLGLLKHGNGIKMKEELLNLYWLWKD